MQVLEYDDPRYPVAGRCLAHPHVFDRRLGVIFYEIAANRGPSIVTASALVATSYLPLIPGRDPDEVLWLEVWPPEAYHVYRPASFAVRAVTYRWFLGQAREPHWYWVEAGVVQTVCGLWYAHDGPRRAAQLTAAAQP